MLDDIASITGISGVYRRAQSHVLNQKGVARIHAHKMSRRYDECRFIVCHIDGGITVNAHRYGKMIDGTEGAGGEGAFTPTRIGSVPALELARYVKTHGEKKTEELCSRSGGFVSHFGTSNSDQIHKMVESGDRKAALVWNAMIYQICKAIGEMAAVLSGRIDAIILTGGLVRFSDIIEGIKEMGGPEVAELEALLGISLDEIASGDVVAYLEENEVLDLIDLVILVAVASDSAFPVEEVLLSVLSAYLVIDGTERVDVDAVSFIEALEMMDSL